MRFKLDANLGTRTRDLLQDQGHDAHTVRDEGKAGSTDRQIYDLSQSEDRCLITLDLDFADVTRFPPRGTSGIVVIRPPQAPSIGLLEGLVGQLLRSLPEFPIQGRLFILQAGRIRVHQSPDE